ncbi:MAG: hypothetical protein ACSHX9_08345 [Luteolibacter sp.]
MSILLIALLPSLVCGGVKEGFVTAKASNFGESSAFSLTKENRAIIKRVKGSYLILQLIESIREVTNGTLTEACTVKWIHVTADGVEIGDTTALLKSKLKERTEGVYAVTKIGGSNHVKVADLTTQFSCGSPDEIILYLPQGTEYAIVKTDSEDSE